MDLGKIPKLTNLNFKQSKLESFWCFVFFSLDISTLIVFTVEQYSGEINFQLLK